MGLGKYKICFMRNFFKKAKKIHFVGIGGIGISALAGMALKNGKTVSGSDISLSPPAEKLAKLGAKIFQGHNKRNLPLDTEIIVYTAAAAPSNNPEIIKARELGIPVLSYPQALGAISAGKKTIAVAGAHGKTTTTAMIARILIGAKKNPEVIVGGLLGKEFGKYSGSNFIPGTGRYFVCEACEYRRAFLNLAPQIAVITNIDTDHLDYYSSLKDIQKAFVEFVGNIKKGGVLVCDASAGNLRPVVFAARKRGLKIIDYTAVSFPENFKLKIPGEHNILNAKAAVATAGACGAPRKKALRFIADFSGTWRRFEYKGRMAAGALVYDDYAHHPTEIKATLKAAREKFKNKKIFCVFQPHLYSRTKTLMDEFAESFADADEIIISDIYAAREKPDKNVNSRQLADKIKICGKKTRFIKNFSAIEKFLRRAAQKEDVIIMMGAGDIFKISENLIDCCGGRNCTGASRL